MSEKSLPQHLLANAKVVLARQGCKEGAGYSDILSLKNLVSRALVPGLPVPEGEQGPGLTVFRDKSVLVKPNWVTHRNLGGHGRDCLITHPNFLFAVLQTVFEAKPAKVIVADAPLQMCRFDQIATREWCDKVSAAATCPVEFIDLRRTISSDQGFEVPPQREVRPMDRYILFDLGEDSLLEPVSSPAGRFRITCYDPDLLARHHRPGCHQYLLCREAFEADVVINLPKLKTHKKTGVTAALKNLVGLNGNKEYLPHHRVGGSWLGGDCYPGFAPLKRLAEYCLDEANRQIGSPAYSQWEKRFFFLLNRHGAFGSKEIEGGWYGNDTVWRMTLDLNRILLYGRTDGTLAEDPQRVILSLTDAVVAGEGEGPLSPTPVDLGLATFSMSSPFADLVHATLMGYDWRRIPLIAEGFGKFRYPLTHLRPEQCEVVVQDATYSLSDIPSFGRLFRPAAGWVNHIEARELGRK